ncbi:MAG: pectate lyase [Terrimicrobiaceae bacterium]
MTKSFPAIALTVFVFWTGHAAAQIGYGRAAKGGAGGRTVVVRSADDLRKVAALPEPLIIQIEGRIAAQAVTMASNKTIEGTGHRPTVHGSLVIPRGTSNVVVRNLIVTNPTSRKRAEGFDGITIRGGRDVWIDHCTLIDCGDGSIDITEGADRITVSHCRFVYSSPDLLHRLVMLAYGPPKKKSRGRLHLTLHHNWFDKYSGSRMPSSIKAKVHSFNNYFKPGSENDYASIARKDAEILSESNFYEGVRNPLFSEDGGKIRSRNDIFEHCRGKFPGKDQDVFKPDYPYETVSASDVPAIVKARAGCPL